MSTRRPLGSGPRPSTTQPDTARPAAPFLVRRPPALEEDQEQADLPGRGRRRALGRGSADVLPELRAELDRAVAELPVPTDADLDALPICPTLAEPPQNPAGHD